MGFHTIITLSYLIPGIYIFARIWQLFIPRRYTILYLILFAFVFAIYPLSGSLENTDGFFAGFVEIFSGYLMGFFLYVFLSLLVTDILLLLNLVFRFISHDKLKDRKFRTRYFLAIMLASFIVVIGGIINFRTIRISDYTISVKARRSDLKQLNIAFVSDFHLGKKVPEHFVERFIRKVKNLNPDVLLYGGDIVEGRGDDIPGFGKMLWSIHTKFGIYGVPGNHDRLTGFYNNFFTKSGIVLLRDSVVVPLNEFAIAGRNEAGNHNRLSAEDIASLAPDSLPLIILDHRPTEPDPISRTKADISFSGHTHNGQLFPINFYLHRVYQLSHGYMKKGNTNFFVSSGIRLWGPRLRTTGKSEIILVHVKFIR